MTLSVRESTTLKKGALVLINNKGSQETVSRAKDMFALDFVEPKTLRVHLRGEWQISGPVPPVKDITAQISGRAGIDKIVFDSSQVKKWDSGMVSFLLQLARECRSRNIDVIRE